METAAGSRGTGGQQRVRTKGRAHRETAAPALFAFMGSVSSFGGLSASRSASVPPHFGNGCFHIGQRKPIIRTHPLSETGSDYMGLVPVTGLEPVRCRQRWILSPLRLPIPSHRHKGCKGPKAHSAQIIIPHSHRECKNKFPAGAVKFPLDS